MRYLASIVVLLLLVSVCLTAPPPLGWTTECKVVRVVDGDTVDVAVTKVIRIRLLDCWAPENSTAEGKESTKELKGMAEGKDGVLHISGASKTMNMLSLNRALGYIWVDGESLSDWQVQGGRATKTRR